MNRIQRRRLASREPKPLRRPKDRSGERWTPLQPATPVPLTEHQIAEHVAFATKHGMTEEEARATIADLVNDEMWKNDVYQVAVRHLEGGPDTIPMVQLSIRRVDREAIHDWRDLQRIKNQLVGPECEAVELYPAESRLVDTANQYFLYCVLDPSFRFPWGFKRRLVSDENAGGSRQRPLAEDQ
jgi:hypothetical protein